MQATGTDTIRPFRDSPITVRRRWYPVPEGTPLLGFPSAFLSAHYQPFPYLPRNVGEVYPSEWKPVKNPTPPGLRFDHVCGTETDFQIGQVYNPLQNTVYDEYWIPECCGRVTMCEEELCATVPVNGADAAQHYSYPIKAALADDQTPVVVRQIALNQGGMTPSWPGTLTAFYPRGVADAPTNTQLQVADDAGQLQFQTNTVRFAADTAITQEWSLAGYSVTCELGGSSGMLALNVIGGQLVIGGSNALVAQSILPPTTSYLDSLPVQAFGNVYATASPLRAGVHELVPLGLLNHAFRLVISPGAVVTCFTAGNTSFLIFPDPTVRIGSGAPGAPFAPAAPFGAWTGVRFSYASGLGLFVDYWLVEYFDASAGPPSMGTVTSVDISTGSSGVTVGGGPITAAGTLTVDIDGAIQDVVALAGVDALIAGDGAGGLASVTPGDYLNYSGGVLDVVPPTATSGQTVGAAFTITAASGTYQATGITVALPSSGTYLISADIRGDLTPNVNAPCYLKAKLHDNTAGADVANSERLLVTSGVLGYAQFATAPLTARVVVTGATTLELYAARVGGPFTTSSISSDTEGRTVVTWTKLAN